MMCDSIHFWVWLMTVVVGRISFRSLGCSRVLRFLLRLYRDSSTKQVSGSATASAPSVPGRLLFWKHTRRIVVVVVAEGLRPPTKGVKKKRCQSLSFGAAVRPSYEMGCKTLGISITTAYDGRTVALNRGTTEVLRRVNSHGAYTCSMPLEEVVVAV
jgi:hypothetical protein